MSDLAAAGRRLAAAADSHNRLEAETIVTELVAELRRSDPAADHSSEEADAKHLLDSLRSQRWFDLVGRAADALVQSGNTAPVVRRHLVQAHIDQGNLTTALTLNEALIADSEPGSIEHNRARGLRGRILKQLYVEGDSGATAGSRQYLQSAIDAYLAVYEKDTSNVWHGINALALMARGARDGVDVKGPDPHELATALLAEVEARDRDRSAQPWDFATAAEACIYLDREDDALRWLDRYARGEYTDAFALGGTLRQLTEVWQLTLDEPPGNHVLPLLQAALLQSEGGAIAHETGANFQGLQELTQDPRFETILGTEAFQEVQWLWLAMERAASIARVEDPVGSPHGTAFVVTAGSLFADAEDPDRLLLVTNSHVVSQEDEGALSPEDATFHFELGVTDVAYAVGRVVAESPKFELDITVVEPEPPLADIEALPLAKAIPRLQERVYIIGHPGGRSLSFSLYDNKLLNYVEPMVHYRTPTEGGSSGSPVFNKNWQLIALHHFGKTKTQVDGEEGWQDANEGVAFKHIIDELGGS